MGKYIQTISGKKAQQIKYFNEKNRSIIIYFDKFFNNSELERYDIFRLHVGKKRVYAMMSKLICDDNNMFLNMNPEIANRVIYAYLTIKKAIDEGVFVKVDTSKDILEYGGEAKRDFGKYQAFISFLTSNLYFPDFVNLVREYVEINHKPIDESLSKKYAEGSSFNNEQLRMFHIIGYLSKFAIPLCTHYVYRNSEKNIKLFEFMYVIFNAIFKIVAVDSETTDLMRKLYKRVELSVKQTENSNKPIWEKFPMYNETKESVVDELVVKIVTTILPKADLDREIVKFIAAVSKDSVIRYKIRGKHPFDCYKVCDSDVSNDEEDKLSETEIWDLYYRNIDENLAVFNRYVGQSVVEDIAKRNAVIIDPAEVDFYMKNYTKHSFAVRVVTQSFATYFSGAANVRSISPREFICLMIILKEKMRNLGIDYLADFISANRHSYSFTRMPSTAVFKALKNNTDYIDIVENKYRYIRNTFDIKTTKGDDKNPIKDMIVSLIHNDYIYCDYNNPKLNGQKIPIDEAKVIDDVLQIYKKMIY